MTIANSGHDENGRYHGGKAGDQTGGEWETRSWYSRPWTHVARFDTEIGEDIAKLARNAANNDLIGYDQYQRTTFWQKLKAARDYDPANIREACEADCSAGVAAIVKAVGYRKGIASLKSVSEDTYTGNEVAHLRNAGAEILTASKYLESDAYLKPGDILINEQHHTAINLTAGASTTKATKATTTKKTETTSGGFDMATLATVKKGSKGATVKSVQALLNAKNSAGLAIDGDAGTKTDAAIKAYQKKKALAVDGQCGPKTWAKLLTE